MFRKILLSAVAVVLIAACTPIQQIEFTRQGSGNGEAVSVDRTGLSAVQATRLAAILTNAGYAVAPASDTTAATARISFSLESGSDRVTEIEVPVYETVQEVRLINGQQRLFTDRRFAGYRTERVVDTIFPAVARIEVASGKGERSPVRTVKTEGTCDDAAILKPILIDVLLADSPPRSTQVELPDC